jgi:hypothetical protein
MVTGALNVKMVSAHYTNDSFHSVSGHILVIILSSTIRSIWRAVLLAPVSALKFWCSKIFFTITFSCLKVSTSNFKYMFLIINHILFDKVHNSSTNIFRFISP